MFLFVAFIAANSVFAQTQPNNPAEKDASQYRIATDEEREALASQGMQIIIRTDDGLPKDWEFADEATIAKLVEAGYWKENASTKTGAWADGQAGSMESEGEYTLIRRKSDPKQYAIVCQKNDGVLEICCIRKLF